jgi:hypothetical protein
MTAMILKSFGVLAALGVLTLGLPARADGPDYEGVLTLLKRSLNESLTEQQRCSFRIAQPDGSAARTFNAGALDVVASAIGSAGVQFDCHRQQQCVTTANGQTATSVTFHVQGDAVTTAGEISRLVEACSASGSH